MARSSLFVVLTQEEAAALVEHGDTAAAIRGLAKIRTALEGARAERPEQLPDVPPLRAKHYRPRGSAITPTHPRSVAVDPPVQPHVRPSTRERSPSPSSSSLSEEDDYVPFRDEADGLYS